MSTIGNRHRLVRAAARILQQLLDDFALATPLRGDVTPAQAAASVPRKSAPCRELSRPSSQRAAWRPIWRWHNKKRSRFENPLISANSPQAVMTLLGLHLSLTKPLLLLRTRHSVMIMLGANPYRALEILPYGTPLGVLGGERLRFIAFRPGWYPGGASSVPLGTLRSERDLPQNDHVHAAILGPVPSAVVRDQGTKLSVAGSGQPLGWHASFVDQKLQHRDRSGRRELPV